MGLLSRLFGNMTAGKSAVPCSAEQLPSGQFAIVAGNFSYTIPGGGKVEFTDRGQNSLYRIEVSYPGVDFFGVAYWTHGSRMARNLDDAVEEEKDVEKSAGLVAVQEEALGNLTARLLTFKDENSQETAYSLVAEVKQSDGKPVIFLLQITPPNSSFSKDTLIQVANSVRANSTAQ